MFRRTKAFQSDTSMIFPKQCSMFGPSPIDPAFRISVWAVPTQWYAVTAILPAHQILWYACALACDWGLRFIGMTKGDRLGVPLQSRNKSWDVWIKFHNLFRNSRLSSAMSCKIGDPQKWKRGKFRSVNLRYGAYQTALITSNSLSRSQWWIVTPCIDSEIRKSLVWSRIS